MSEIRRIAAEIAHNAMFGDIDVEPALESVLRSVRPEHRQGMLLRELAVESVRRSATLDAIIGAYSRVGFSEIEPRVLTALRVGTYEITFMEQGAPYAAIDSMARVVHIWNPRAYSFTRGVLRSIREGAGTFVRGEPGGKDPCATLQVGDSLWRRFDRKVFADPRTRQSDYLAAVYSLPLWLVEKLLDQYGRSAQDIMAQCNGQAPAVIQANLLRNDRGELAKILADQGLSVDRGGQRQALVAREPVDLRSLPAYLHGFFSVADEFDIASVDYLNARPGERICVLQGRAQTMCQIAQAVTPGGRVTGCVGRWEEAGAVLLEKERLGLDNIQLVVLQVRDASSVLNTSFDRVFVEPVSTGVGKLRRSAVARWRLDGDVCLDFARRQKLALSCAIELCAAGGIVVYAVSSFLREENDEVVGAATRHMYHVRPIESSVQLPSRGGPDGGFRAKIAKLSSL